MNDYLLKEAIKELLGWTPESSKPSDFADFRGWPEEMPENGIPFISESFLYPVLGKDDARSFLLRVRRVIEAIGYDMFTLEVEINQAKNKTTK